MGYRFCLVLLISLILCFAILLAWLAARWEEPNCVRLTVLPGGGREIRIRLETSCDCLVLTLRHDVPCSEVSRSVPSPAEDHE